MTRNLILVLITVICSSSGFASEDRQSMSVDEVKVKVWNRFASQLMELQKQQIALVSTRTESRRGGYQGEYFNEPDFYVEESYYRQSDGKLVSRIKREKEKPQNVHVLEVYIYDAEGRVRRDYLVAYLPWGRNAPIQALVNLHAYNEGLHSFRQFDASGERVYEHCSGIFDGKDVQISLESHEMAPPRIGKNDYRQCFTKTPLSAADYLPPQ